MNAVAHPTRGTPATPASGLSIRPEDVVGFLTANIILILAMWIRHGGLDQLGTIAGLATATGQLTALIGTFLSLIQLLLMSRARGWTPRSGGTASPSPTGGSGSRPSG